MIGDGFEPLHDPKQWEEGESVLANVVFEGGGQIVVMEAGRSDREYLLVDKDQGRIFLVGHDLLDLL